MKTKRSSLMLVGLLVSACGFFEDEVPNLEQHLATVEESLGEQSEALARIEATLARIEARRPGSTRRAPRTPLDPDLERRRDEAGVKFLEEVVKEDNLEAMGKLGRQFIEQELERRKSK